LPGRQEKALLSAKDSPGQAAGVAAEFSSSAKAALDSAVVSHHPYWVHFPSDPAETPQSGAVIIIHHALFSSYSVYNTPSSHIKQSMYIADIDP
jgi:hypothetical protein